MSQANASTRSEGPHCPPPADEPPLPQVALCSSLREGDRLGRYELMRRIGVGGMAEVWAARLSGSRGFQKIVAVKVLAPHLSGDPEFERLFLCEASIVSELRHPHVASVIDLGEHNGLLFLVMEWFDGLTVGELIRSSRSRGGVPVPIAVRILMQAAAGLHAAHEFRDPHGALLGLVHCDVSSQNLLVTFDGATHVLDFGVARLAASSPTHALPIIGKARYMAPEQARGEPLDRRADVFALGVVAYRLTTAAYPFKGDPQQTPLDLASSDQPAIPPSSVKPDYPLALERIVLQALEKDPARRYATANDLLSALDALPRELRASTDEDVAVFVRTALDQSAPSSRPSLRQLLDVAGSRPPLASDPTGATSGIHHAEGGVRRPDPSEPPPRAHSTVPPAWTEELKPKANGPEVRPRGRHRMAWITAGILAGLLGVVLVRSTASPQVTAGQANPGPAVAAEVAPRTEGIAHVGAEPFTAAPGPTTSGSAAAEPTSSAAPPIPSASVTPTAGATNRPWSARSRGAVRSWPRRSRNWHKEPGF